MNIFYCIFIYLGIYVVGIICSYIVYMKWFRGKDDPIGPIDQAACAIVSGLSLFGILLMLLIAFAEKVKYFVDKYILKIRQ